VYGLPRCKVIEISCVRVRIMARVRVRAWVKISVRVKVRISRDRKFSICTPLPRE